MRNRTLWSAVALLTVLLADGAHADCILNAKSKTSFVILDNHTLILRGGIGKDIVVKSFHFFNSGSQVTVLKDNFCDFENAALYVDGEVVDVQQVKSL